MTILRTQPPHVPTAPPAWALAQRNLIHTMNGAAPAFQSRYTRADGSFIWREKWPGMDGSDDGYESYHNWPLLYALGGAEDLYPQSRFLWEAVTRQFTEYGQVWREFDAYYDWMHHGESSLLLYYFGLCDPRNSIDIGRVTRFAAMYTGEDPQAPNWDAARRQMRSPINGSRGPRLQNTWEDWETHRAVLANYPAPFEDIPGAVSTEEGPVADWNNDTVYAEILQRLNSRQMQGDVPLNLTATSLITHAFLYTGEDRYRRWVVDYLEAWQERIQRNDGLCPDNVGPNGIIGETLDGKWWGGYYGWRWPHGFMTILQPLLIAAMNAVLLTGDWRYLDIPRGQLDRILELGREEDGVLLAPHRHTDEGWKAYRPVSAELPLQLAYFSHAGEDFARLDQFPERGTKWIEVLPGRGKGDDIHIAPWHCYLQGCNPDYPEKILAAQWTELARRMERMRNDDGDPETWDVHHWQDINPVHTEALVQLTMGGPQVIYHGGLLHVRMRHYDAGARRPGLPPDVAVLVHHLDAESVTAAFVNTSPLESRQLIVQAGAFGEHQWTDAMILDGDTADRHAINDRFVEVHLAPGQQMEVRLRVRRFVNAPRHSSPFPA